MPDAYSSASERRSYDAKVGSVFESNDLMERVLDRLAEKPESVSPHLKIAAGHYKTARDAAQRLAAGGGA